MVNMMVIFLIIISTAPAGVPREEPGYELKIAGVWQTLFEPSVAGIYINDHCLYRDGEGDWHLVGITGERPWFGQGERWFAHGVTGSLGVPMRELDPLFKGWPDDAQKWAPHAVWSGDTLHLFAGPGQIRHFVSRDGYQFEYVGDAIADEWRWLRDTMVLGLDDGSWLMYATDRRDGRDVVSVFRSQDLYKWEFAGVAFIAKRPAPVWAPFPNSALESPFVIKKDDGYYLSVCLTNYPLNPRSDVYLNTLVFYSTDPLEFGVYAPGRRSNTARLVTRFETHAPEYVEDENGKWWITSSGWIGYPRPAGCEGGRVCIAPIEWASR